MFMPRPQAMQTGVDELPANVNETIGPHHGEYDLAFGHESRLTAALDVELGNAAM